MGPVYFWASNISCALLKGHNWCCLSNKDKPSQRGCYSRCSAPDASTLVISSSNKTARSFNSEGVWNNTFPVFSPLFGKFVFFLNKLFKPFQTSCWSNWWFPTRIAKTKSRSSLTQRLLRVSADAATLFQLENSGLVINVVRHLMCLPRFHLRTYWLCMHTTRECEHHWPIVKRLMNKCMKQCFYQVVHVRRFFGRYPESEK